METSTNPIATICDVIGLHLQIEIDKVAKLNQKSLKSSQNLNKKAQKRVSKDINQHERLCNYKIN